MGAVRNWFVETAKRRRIESPTKIWFYFSDFTGAFYKARRKEGFTDDDLNMMPVPEYLDFIQRWVAELK